MILQKIDWFLNGLPTPNCTFYETVTIQTILRQGHIFKKKNAIAQKNYYFENSPPQPTISSRNLTLAKVTSNSRIHRIYNLRSRSQTKIFLNNHTVHSSKAKETIQHAGKKYLFSLMQTNFIL